MTRDDISAESLTRKLVQHLKNLLKNADKLTESLVVEGRTPDGYMKSFKWDGAKFNMNLSVAEILRDINKVVFTFFPRYR